MKLYGDNDEDGYFVYVSSHFEIDFQGLYVRHKCEVVGVDIYEYL